mgnify:CR=1 FL=1
MLEPIKHIVIVGAGELGSRHLQGLSRVNIPIRISVVDPSPEALAKSQLRLREMVSNSNVQDVEYLASLMGLSQSPDLAIVSTNSDIRATVTRSLVETFSAKNLVLEKILFQRENEYEEIGVLLSNSGVKTWVNHPRRLFPRYKELKIFLSDKGPFSYDVRGGNWGLACNGLHFLDHLAYLSESDELAISTSGLDKSIVKSKRSGFVEVNGSLTGTIGRNSFSLHCDSSSEKLRISIQAGKTRIFIDEAAGVIETKNSENVSSVEGKIICYQSELTNNLVENILRKGTCELPSFAEAAKLHLPFIKALGKHINSFDSACHIGCPIT